MVSIIVSRLITPCSLGAYNMSKPNPKAFMATMVIAAPTKAATVL